MKLRFRTSIATGLGGFVEGQVIDVRTVPREFQAWIDRGDVVVVPDDVEDAALDPLGQTATLTHSRPFRGRGRGRRSSVSRPVPA